MQPQELYSKGMRLTEMENGLENGWQFNLDEFHLSWIIISAADAHESYGRVFFSRRG